MTARFQVRPALVLMAAFLASTPSLPADDWLMFGRDKTRNAVSPEKNLPLEWDIRTGRNIKWKVPIGSRCFSTPVVANGLVWIGSNNDKPKDKNFTGPAGVLLCFRESDGGFLYQHVSPHGVDSPRVWSSLGYSCSLMSEQDRLWFVSTRAETICLEAGPIQRGEGQPREIWKVDLRDEFGIFPTTSVMGGGQMCSIGASHGDLIYVITSNGKDWTRSNLPAPLAPGLVCLNKTTGKLVWEDNSPGTNIIFGEWGNPLVIEIEGRTQVIVPQGDGWVRSFDAASGKLIWKFDINPKSTRRQDANYFMSAPVYYKGRIYLAGGRDIEAGVGPGRLCCLDPTRTGDISLELEDGPGKGKANPNSGAVWHFDELGRTMSTVVIDKDLVVAPDFSGAVYCLDARTGGKYWKHEMGVRIVGSSPLIVDGKIYIGEQDGILSVLALTKEKTLLGKYDVGPYLYSSAIFANGVLYIASGGFLYAIQNGHSAPPSTPNPPAKQ